MINRMVKKDKCTPAETSKLKMLAFLLTSAFGKLSRGGAQVFRSSITEYRSHST